MEFPPFYDKCAMTSVSDECAVCTDVMSEHDSLCLPGCGHRFHLRCVMNFCRYNTHCPICRQLPEGVEAHQPEPPRVEATVFLSLDDVVQEVDNVIDEQRRTWQRYRNRRRRALNSHPHLKTLFERLQLLRRDMTDLHTTTHRLYSQRCREVWRSDVELNERKRTLSRMQRRERRMERSLYDQLRELVGSEP